MARSLATARTNFLNQRARLRRLTNGGAVCFGAGAP